LSKN
jgi:hypothetical protein